MKGSALMNGNIGYMTCSKCQSLVTQRTRSYNCQCTTVWKEIAGKTITEAIAKELFTKGRTGVLEGFKSKTGNFFQAMLVIENGKVVFQYPDKVSSDNQTKNQTRPPTLPQNEHNGSNTHNNLESQDGSVRMRIESGNSGTGFVSVPGIIRTYISYGLVPSRMAECLGCITAANLIKHHHKGSLPKLDISVNNLDFAKYILKEHIPRNTEMKRSLEYLWKVLGKFPEWTAKYEHIKKSRLLGSPQSTDFPKNIFPDLIMEVRELEGQGKLKVILPNYPDVIAQFLASIRKAESCEDGAFLVPKSAENVLKAWKLTVQRI